MADETIPPHYSEDGHWWWDGTRWLQVQQPVPPPPVWYGQAQASQPVASHASHFFAGFNGCLGVGCAVIVVIGAIFLLLGAIGNSAVNH